MSKGGDHNTEASSPVISVAGPASVDLTLCEPPADWIGDVGREIYTTETMFSLKDPVAMGLGGNGAAAAFVLGQLGLRVRLNAPIGDDPAGSLVRTWLEQAGVQIIAPPGRSTMLAITAVDGQDRRLGCLQYPGPTVDWTLSSSDTDATWLLIGVHAKVPVADLDQIQKVLGDFRQQGRIGVLDSGVGWLGHVKPDRIHELWSHVDLLIGTIEELRHWTGCYTPMAMAESALRAGVRQVVIKMGSEGAAYQSDTEPFTHQSACPVNRAGLSIGAGDAFNGALVAAIARGKPMSVAVSQSQQVAAKVVESGCGVLGWSE